MKIYCYIGALGSLLLPLAAPVLESETQEGHSESSEIRTAQEGLTRSIQLARQAYRLIALGRDLDVAETLLLESNRLSESTNYGVMGNLATLFESQGRLREARDVFRPVVWLSEERSSTSENDPRHLLRYALLCRAVGDQKEEVATLARIPGDGPLAQMMTAFRDSRALRDEAGVLRALGEIRRLDPSATWVVAETERSRKSLAKQREAARKIAAREEKLPPP